MSKTSPSRKADALRVLIAGGGVAALETMLATSQGLETVIAISRESLL